MGYVLETPTWRSNPDWGTSLGYTRDQLDALDRDAVAFLVGIQASSSAHSLPISGCIGPRGDGYAVGDGDVRARRRASITRIRSGSSPMPGATSCRC